MERGKKGRRQPKKLWFHHLASLSILHSSSTVIHCSFPSLNSSFCFHPSSSPGPAAHRRNSLLHLSLLAEAPKEVKLCSVKPHTHLMHSGKRPRFPDYFQIYYAIISSRLSAQECTDKSKGHLGEMCKQKTHPGKSRGIPAQAQGPVVFGGYLCSICKQFTSWVLSLHVALLQTIVKSGDSNKVSLLSILLSGSRVR